MNPNPTEPAPQPILPPEAHIVPSEGYQPEWSAFLRQLASVALMIAVVFALTLLLPVLSLLVTTALLAFLIQVPSRIIAKHTPLTFGGAVVLVYLLLIVAILFITLAVLPNAVQGIISLTRDMQLRYNELRDFLRAYTPEQGQVMLFEVATIDLDPFLSPLRDLLLGTGDAVIAGQRLQAQAPFDIGRVVTVATSTVASLLGSVGSLAGTFFLALFLSFLVLMDLPNYETNAMQSVSPAYQREFAILMNRLSAVWNGFFRGQLTVGLVIGILTYIQLLLMGVSQPVLVAVVVALISLIPTIGGFIALVPLGLVPLIQGSSVFLEMNNALFAILVVGVNLLWTQVIWNVVAPKIIGDAVSLPLPAIIIGIFIGTALGGALGAFLIVPILGSLRVLAFYVLAKIGRRDPYPGVPTPEVVKLSSL
jgi:predicted PurR-regulated permease PerM